MPKLDDTSLADEVRRYVLGDPALYSVWAPGDVTTAAIQRTVLDPVQTFDEIIERDDLQEACVTYLIENGAPCFVSAILQEACADALEGYLRAGARPPQARDAAMRKVGGAASTPRQPLWHAKRPRLRQKPKVAPKQAAP